MVKKRKYLVINMKLYILLMEILDKYLKKLENKYIILISKKQYKQHLKMDYK